MRTGERSLQRLETNESNESNESNEKATYFFDRSASWPYHCAPMAETLAENHDSLPLLPPLPTRLEASKAFRQNLTLEGSVDLSELRRLREYLADEQGMVVVKLSFEKDDAGYRTMQGVVRAQVHAQCQRCLEPMALRLEEPLSLAVVTSEEVARQLPDDLDPWLMEPDDDVLIVANIVEDQLILAMPIVSLHTECSADSTAQQKLDELQKAAGTVSDDRTQNPFAVLAQLKSDPSQKSD